MTNFPKYSRWRFHILDFKLSDGGTVENFRWVRKMLGMKPNPLPMMSRIDLLRMVHTRPKRQVSNPQQKWAVKKAMQYFIKQGWGIALDDTSN